MDVDTVDQEFQQLQSEAQQTTQAVQQLATKLQAAGDAGNSDAKEWILDLKSIALQIQQEQLQVQALLQALHGFAVNALQPAAPVPVQQLATQQPPPPPQGGGVLSRFMGGNFGQAMVSGVGMGAGFGIADSVINSIFGN